MVLTLFGVAIFNAVVVSISGHGMMLDPPNRSSLWRYNSSFPKNYDDNQNFCGGFATQWDVNQGKCGICGDAFGDPIPRANENTGTYGLGFVVKSYAPGSVIDIGIKLTANHLGKFSYSLCKLDDSSQPETENCFVNLYSESGEQWFPVYSGQFLITNRVKLPAQFTCDHCVLRWYYRTGNRWGECEDGSGALGKSVEDYKLSVIVGNCKTPPCRLKKGRLVLLEFKFTPDRPVKTLTNIVHAQIGAIPFPFIGVDSTPATDYIFESDGKTKASFPLTPGQEYIYKNPLKVLEIYPVIKVDVHWELQADDGNPVSCFEVGATIVN
ncbi:hypothetical protein FQR65_LT09090 [Abscondita terminalis]|nr:hypothetical protein FQR65_LT09090 [Abscondita terminalis]